MRGFGQHERLGLANRLSFVASCRWQGCLYDLGRFPGAVPGTGTVQGELFRLSESEVWTILDRYEGYEPGQEETSLFVRTEVQLQAPDDQTAWIYWFNGDPTGHPRVSSGDWAEYVQQTDWL